ncbi:hypothetical protein CAPTEDRAFT_195355, partial [Capitella teleta]
LHEIRKVCSAAGISSIGTKLECLNRLGDKIRRKDATFNKIFTKFAGSSGGLLVACCPHGITYGMKFLLRGESPRDHLDLLFSFKHIPTLTICDIPGFVARHAAKRRPGLFKPNDGRFAEASEENLKNISGLKISIPELDFSSFFYNACERDHSYSVGHPVTNTDHKYFDRFHQHNSRTEADKLRRLDLVQELRGGPRLHLSMSISCHPGWMEGYLLAQLKMSRNRIREFLKRRKPNTPTNSFSAKKVHFAEATRPTAKDSIVAKHGSFYLCTSDMESLNEKGWLTDAAALSVKNWPASGNHSNVWWDTDGQSLFIIDVSHLFNI